jgi:hypothetical protein
LWDLAEQMNAGKRAGDVCWSIYHCRQNGSVSVYYSSGSLGSVRFYEQEDAQRAMQMLETEKLLDFLFEAP